MAAKGVRCTRFSPQSSSQRTRTPKEIRSSDRCGWGEPVAEVSARLGRGTPVRCWYGKPDCTALAYTDGDAIVRVAVRNGEVDRVRIDANASATGVARLPKSIGAIASWHWDGGRVLTAPTALFPGWLPCGTGPIGTEWCGGSWLNRRAIEMQFAMQDGRVARAELSRA